MDENKNTHQEAVPGMPEPCAPLRQPYTYTPPPRLTFPMGKGELAFGIAILLCSLLLCNSLFFAGINLGFALGTAGTVLCTWLYLRRRGHRCGKYAACLMGLSLAIIAALPRSDDGGLKFLALCALLLIPSLAFCLLAGQNLRSPDGVSTLLDGFRALFALGFGRMGEAGRGIKAACSSTGAIGRKGSSVALGLLIALPLLAVLVPLLMSADAAFEGLLDLLPEPDWHELLLTVLTGVFLGFVLYTRGAALHHLPKNTRTPKSRKGLNGITVNTVLICAVVVYAVYLVSQLAYFVGGFSGLLPEEYTLAQYARRGFFEMAWLAAINLTVIALSVGLVSAKERVSLLTKLLCLFLGLVTLFLICTASAKMLLYIGSYGLTRLRVLTEAFMVWLALSTVFVCVWLFRPKTAYMKPILLTALTLCAALLWVDVDTQIARYNVRAYQSGKLETVDVVHLGGLSDGAVPCLYELTKDTDPEISEKAQDILRNWDLEEPDLRSWNFSRAAAVEILRQFHADEIARAMGLDTFSGELELLKNTYSNYHSYGEYAALIRMSEADLAEMNAWLESGGSVASLPLPDALSAVLYGSTGGKYRGPFFAGAFGEPGMPAVETGFYYFYDRNVNSTDPESPLGLHTRSTMNFTLVVFDADSNILYFFMKDT